MNVSYKDYVIKPAPYPRREPKVWGIKIYIEHHTEKGVNSKPYTSTYTFETKEEAITYCINFGRSIIDGEIGGCTIDDL